MKHKTAARDALSMVSYVFLFVGVIALTEMIWHTAKGSFHFNFGILGIGIFAGLRRYSRVWRYCALLFTWYGIVTVSIALYISLNGAPVSRALMFNSQRISNLPSSSLSIPLLMVLFVTLWQYRILTHSAVRRLFDVEPIADPATETRPGEAPAGGAVVKQ